MFKLLNNIKIRTRMLISVSLFIATLLFAMYGGYVSLGANVDFAIQEKLGDYYQKPLADVLYDAGQLRTMLVQETADSKSQVDLKQVTSEIAAGMAQLKQVHDVVREKLQFTDEGLKSRGREHLKYETVAAKWAALASEIQENPEKNHDEGLVSFIADIRGMIAHSGDTSNLVLDPDLDSYYLMDVTLLALPQSIDRLAEIGSSTLKQLSSASILSKDDQIRYAVYARLMTADDIGRIAADFDTSFKEDKNFYGQSPTYQKNIQPLLEDYQAKNKILTEMLDQLSQGTLVSASDFLPAWQAATDSAYKLWTASIAELDILLDKRIASYRSQQMNGLMMSIAGIIISVIFYQLVVGSLITPLAGMVRAMTCLADQKLDVDIPYAGAKSEIGAMAGALQVFKENAVRMAEMKAEEAQQEKLMEAEKRRAMRQLADDFESKIEGIISMVSSTSLQLCKTADKMKKAVAVVNMQAGEAASLSSETSNNVQGVAAAIEEMSASANEIAAQVSKSTSTVNEAVSKTHNADAAVQSLSGAVAQIGEISSLIEGIASQINLLALNATIEAARSGEAGKGFAVVASEVKNLATQTTNATAQITQNIENVKDVSKQVANALSLIHQSIQDVNHFSSGIASAVEEQSAATNEIAGNLQRASQGVQSSNDNIADVSKGVVDADAGAVDVLNAANMLSQQSEMLNLQVQTFLSDIRKDNAA